MKCPDCGGTGNTANFGVCSTCSGDGELAMRGRAQAAVEPGRPRPFSALVRFFGRFYDLHLAEGRSDLIAEMRMAGWSRIADHLEQKFSAAEGITISDVEYLSREVSIQIGSEAAALLSGSAVASSEKQAWAVLHGHVLVAIFGLRQSAEYLAYARQSAEHQLEPAIYRVVRVAYRIIEE